MRHTVLLLFALTQWCPLLSYAGQPKKVWDVNTGEQAGGVFPYQVIQRSLSDVQIVSNGRPGRVLTILSSDRATVRTVAQGQEHPGVLGEEFHFTLTGNMALFLPNQERAPSYVRAFDPTSGEFAGGEPYVFKSRPEFAVGEKHIAAFEEIDRRHVLYPPEKVELYIVSHNGSAFASEKVWEDDQYTTVRAMDINGTGDVAAIVAQCGPPIARQCDCRLLVVRDRRATAYPAGDDLNCPDAVAISPNGTLVAVAIRTRVVVYRVGAFPVQIGQLSTDRCDLHGTGNVFKLAVNDDGRIAAWLIALEGGKPPGHWHVVAGGSNRPCESIAQYDFQAVRQPRVRFLPGNHLFVTAEPMQGGEAVASVLELN